MENTVNLGQEYIYTFQNNGLHSVLKTNKKRHETYDVPALTYDDKPTNVLTLELKYPVNLYIKASVSAKLIGSGGATMYVEERITYDNASMDTSTSTYQKNSTDKNLDFHIETINNKVNFIVTGVNRRVDWFIFIEVLESN